MLHTSVKEFFRDEEGGAALEYLLLAGVLGIGWVAAGTEYRDTLVGLFEKISRDLSRIRIG